MATKKTKGNGEDKGQKGWTVTQEKEDGGMVRTVITDADGEPHYRGQLHHFGSEGARRELETARMIVGHVHDDGNDAPAQK